MHDKLMVVTTSMNGMILPRIFLVMTLLEMVLLFVEDETRYEI